MRKKQPPSAPFGPTVVEFRLGNWIKHRDKAFNWWLDLCNKLAAVPPSVNDVCLALSVWQQHPNSLSTETSMLNGWNNTFTIAEITALHADLDLQAEHTIALLHCANELAAAILLDFCASHGLPTKPFEAGAEKNDPALSDFKHRCTIARPLVLALNRKTDPQHADDDEGLTLADVARGLDWYVGQGRKRRPDSARVNRLALPDNGKSKKAKRISRAAVGEYVMANGLEWKPRLLQTEVL